MTTQSTFNPPRMVNEPMQPLPQTVCATLEHSGLPISQSEMITDIPPSIDWFSQIQLFKNMFSFTTLQKPREKLWETAVMPHREGGTLLSGGTLGTADLPTYWNYLPFMGSKWWKGIVSYKLIAIKPPRVTGKILIRYSFDPVYNFDEDAQRRSIAVEWDLGLSSEIEFDVHGLSPLEARPTYIPSTLALQAPSEVLWLKQIAPIPTWTFGKLRFECAQMLNPGSIFPDSIRILVFMVYKNSQYFQPTDFRSLMNTVLSVDSATQAVNNE
ncbi:MAG: capsid protein [Guiyang polycipivirus 2]|nr:MAG: capsid protein [Guiyang polycipivirus 2]